MVAEGMACDVITAYNLGVAGIHKLFPHLKAMLEEDVDAIFHIPTSIGYGLGEKGIGALTSMLQTCFLSLAVVNIDSGIPAGVIAALIANRIEAFAYIAF